MLTNLSSKAEVEKLCPWYYRMKALIGKHPNTKPVGIGNSTSELDLDVLMTSARGDASGLEDLKPIVLSENDDDDDDRVEDQHHAQNKRLASVAGLDEDVKPKMPAHPNVSKPTTTVTKPKKLKGFEELVKIAAVEETTRQKELDLEIQWSKDKMSRVAVKAEFQRVLIEAKREKAKQAHEMEMMKLQLELAKVHQAAPGIADGVHTQLGPGSSVHSPGLYPAFSPRFTFGDSGQFDRVTSGNQGGGHDSMSSL